MTDNSGAAFVTGPQPVKVPLVAVLTNHPLSIVRGVIGVLTTAATGYVASVYGVNSGINTGGTKRTTVLIALPHRLRARRLCATARRRVHRPEPAAGTDRSGTDAVSDHRPRRSR
ncbi:hypothetical protein GCM10017786_15040 [Amycolatopsis deserti]|uniref:Uncharacterized protein n=1 Tax=Amycolatopsis deserti TaxID=185696 RepID=A0ABQ3II80_9PSEU|nr:hypothetical protein [Amycolatopsis deserti]GHE84377.1 hypothetical protein GCM10017786_15040 [Amycolatopsis deserti]